MRKLWNEWELWAPFTLLIVLVSFMELNQLYLNTTRGPLPEHLRN